MQFSNKLLNFYLKKSTLLNSVLILIIFLLMTFLFYNYLYFPKQSIVKIKQQMTHLSSTVQINQTLYKKIENRMEEKMNLNINYQNIKNPFINQIQNPNF